MRSAHLQLLPQIILAISLSLTTGCGDSAPSSGIPPIGGDENQNLVVDDGPYLRVSPTNLEFLARPDHWLELVHIGRRQVSFYDANGVETSFIERVATDGTGQYAIDPVEALTPLATDWDSFRLRQLSLQGFIFRHRDFAIRDIELFQEHWTLEELGYNSTIAGRRCDLFQAKHSGVAVAPSYQLLIDDKGLVRAYREYSSAGQLLSEVRYLSFNGSPTQEELDQVIWYESIIDDATELDWSLPLEPQLPQLNGKSLFQPRWLPLGHTLRRASRATIADRSWLRLTYTDGVESILYAVDLPPEEVDGQMAPPYSPQASADSLRVHSVGRTSALQGTLRHREIMVLGKADPDLLIDIAQSVLP